MIAFIVNPVAGSGYAAKAWNQIEKELIKRELVYTMMYTDHPEHATELAREAASKEDCTTVVAVGGDGTAYEVACGLLGTDVGLGIIPVGTGNDFIKSIATPSKPLEALEFILSHPARPADVGKLNDRMFLNVCGTGFDVTVLDSMTAAKKYARGIWPYLIGLILGIAHYKPVHVRFSADGETQERDILICSVANGRYFGGGIQICPDARPDDGMLDMIVVENRPRWMIPFYIPGLLLGKVLSFKITTHKRCREFTILSKGMRLNVDGEILSMDEARFSVLPGCLRIHW